MAFDKARKSEQLAPGLRRLLAPNAGPMTGEGTNTYLVGRREIAVIDPGPRDLTHLGAILNAAGSGTITAILVTHAHKDHSDLVPALREATGAKVYGFGPATAGRAPVMERLAEQGQIAGGEGLDAGFTPDVALKDGDRVAGDGWEIEALHLPGHFAGHLGFAFRKALFTGDLVMGWTSTLISPPDGDLGRYFSSLYRLRDRADEIYYPGHGAPVADPRARVDDLLRHRETRDQEIARALARGPATAADLARRVYHDLPEALLPAATRNTLAHLIQMTLAHRATCPAPLRHDSVFSLAAP